MVPLLTRIDGALAGWFCCCTGTGWWAGVGRAGVLA